MIKAGPISYQISRDRVSLCPFLDLGMGLKKVPIDSFFRNMHLIVLSGNNPFATLLLISASYSELPRRRGRP
jgi:hypothetical protein